MTLINQSRLTEILDEHIKKEKQRFLGNQSVDKTMVIAWDRYKAGLQWDDKEINKLVKLELEKLSYIKYE